MQLFADSTIQPDDEVWATSTWPKTICLSKDSNGQTAAMVPIRTEIENKQLNVHSTFSSGF